MRYRALAVSSSLLLATAVAHAAPQDARQPAERLDRGIVAVQPEKGKVFVSWRLLESDAEKVAFNVYRSSGSGTPTKLNAEPIANVTFFEDTSAGTGEAKYVVRPVVDGKELEASEGFALAADAPVGQYIQVPLKTPADYSVGDCSAADLDGDGQYELIVHFVGRGKDNSQKGETDPPILAAYRLDGHELWRINLGHNIREGRITRSFRSSTTTATARPS